MPGLRYDEARSASYRLVMAYGSGIYARNRTRYMGALANTMERWFIELRGNNRMLINLTSPNHIVYHSFLEEYSCLGRINRRYYTNGLGPLTIRHQSNLNCCGR